VQSLSSCLQAWTNKCIFSHDLAGLQRLGYGENLSLIGGPWEAAIELWLNEAGTYKYGYNVNGGWQAQAGHFTQVRLLVLHAALITAYPLQLLDPPGRVTSALYENHAHQERVHRIIAGSMEGYGKHRMRAERLHPQVGQQLVELPLPPAGQLPGRVPGKCV